jgi:hypothetical protein
MDSKETTGRLLNNSFFTETSTLLSDESRGLLRIARVYEKADEFCGGAGAT